MHQQPYTIWFSSGRVYAMLETRSRCKMTGYRLRTIRTLRLWEDLRRYTMNTACSGRPNFHDIDAEQERWTAFHGDKSLNKRQSPEPCGTSVIANEIGKLIALHHSGVVISAGSSPDPAATALKFQNLSPKWHFPRILSSTCVDREFCSGTKLPRSIGRYMEL